MSKIFLSKINLSVASTYKKIATNSLFNENHTETNTSAIDEFHLRLIDINKISPPPHEFNPLFGQLILLGVIAAVESYFRTIFRKLITIDKVCKETIQNQPISYTAAIHLDHKMLPEAILEKTSFASKKNILDTIRDIIGIKGDLPPDVDSSLNDFVTICQLRHCAVHRFGKLGTSNAIKLGLDKHKHLLEKPLELDYESLQISISICNSMVKTINNFLFNKTISRIPETEWTLNPREGKRLFSSYYKIFSDNTSSSHKSLSLNSIYQEFSQQRSDFFSGN